MGKEKKLFLIEFQLISVKRMVEFSKITICPIQQKQGKKIISGLKSSIKNKFPVSSVVDILKVIGKGKRYRIANTVLKKTKMKNYATQLWELLWDHNNQDSVLLVKKKKKKINGAGQLKNRSINTVNWSLAKTIQWSKNSLLTNGAGTIEH